LKSLPRNELTKRLYVVGGIEGIGRLTMRLHSAISNNRGSSEIDFVDPKDVLYLMPKNMLIENYDFRISTKGDVELLF
jgi:hypothetical protein